MGISDQYGCKWMCLYALRPRHIEQGEEQPDHAADDQSGKKPEHFRCLLFRYDIVQNEWHMPVGQRLPVDNLPSILSIETGRAAKFSKDSRRRNPGIACIMS
jgi:hypothetical protein